MPRLPGLPPYHITYINTKRNDAEKWRLNKCKISRKMRQPCNSENWEAGFFGRRINESKWKEARALLLADSIKASGTNAPISPRSKNVARWLGKTEISEWTAAAAASAVTEICIHPFQPRDNWWFFQSCLYNLSFSPFSGKKKSSQGKKNYTGLSQPKTQSCLSYDDYE